jgi:hypothetical protein
MNFINASAKGVCNVGCNLGHEDAGSTLYPVYSSSGGNGFTTGGALYGSTVVRPTVTTTYTLQCVGASFWMGGWNFFDNIFGPDGNKFPAAMPNAQLSVTVTISDPCPTAVPTTGNGGWALAPGGPRRFNAGGHNMCLTNNSGKTMFIGRSQAEIDSFFNALSRLGVTQQ